jgi:hypothetical protein
VVLLDQVRDGEIACHGNGIAAFVTYHAGGCLYHYQYNTVHKSEWALGLLKKRLGELAPQRVGTNRQGVGGTPRQYPWDEWAVGFGAWLHERPGRENLPRGQHIKEIVKIAMKLGHPVPDRRTIGPYRDRWLAAYLTLHPNT